MGLVVWLGLVAVDFAMVEFSCALGVIVKIPGTLVLTYYSSGFSFFSYEGLRRSYLIVLAYYLVRIIIVI